MSKAKRDVMGLDEQRHKEHEQVENTLKGYARLERWLRKGKVEAVGLQATGRYSAGLAEYLYAAG